MNLSTVINDIKMPLGLQTIALPFDAPTEKVLAQVIQTSVRTFSQFKPWQREAYESIRNLQAASEVERKMGVFVLPNELTRTPVLFAEAYLASSQYQDETVATNAFTVGTPFVGFGSEYPQDILNAGATGAALNKYAGVTSRAQSSRWLGSNKIQLYDFPSDAFVKFVASCEHDPSLETIPESCRESFIELATLDVKRFLYNVLKNMNNVGSAFKETQLRIDDWSGAEEARKALIDRWTNTFHWDDSDMIFFM